ncbi:MAG: flagellar basal body P-ring formation chaperone FlgA [Desulfosarcinaceae bacterium]|nr:flagellar basal body P-ring formation chaperone FlgA [Desulfosarcinaceae bacterium]
MAIRSPHTAFLRGALLVLLYTILNSAQMAAAASLTIRGNEAVAVSQETLLLGQVAEVIGENAALRQAVEQIVLGPAPKPGRSTTIDAAAILRRLKSRRIDKAAVHIDMDRPIKVTRKSATLEAARIKTAVTVFLQREMPWPKKAVRIKTIRGLASLTIPAGKADLKVTASRGSKYLGSVPLAVSIFSNGEFYKRVWVTAVIEVRSQVVVVAKPLGRHQPIAADDLKLVATDLSEVPSNAITRIDAAVGMRTKRKLFPKTVLREDYLEAPYVVQRGDLVQMVASSDTLKLTAQGITKERGRKGERIRVENTDSKKQVYAIVVDASTVEVQF